MSEAMAWIGVDSQAWQAFRATCEAHSRQRRVLLESVMAALAGWEREERLLDAAQHAQMDAVIAHAQELMGRHELEIVGIVQEGT